MAILDKHKIIETNATLLLVLSFLVVAIGGLVEIVPLFWLQNTIEKVEGMRPYSPLELTGRDIYIREGCYVCHSQMIRPFRHEVLRYGDYSLIISAWLWSASLPTGGDPAFLQRNTCWSMVSKLSRSIRNMTKYSSRSVTRT